MANYLGRVVADEWIELYRRYCNSEANMMPEGTLWARRRHSRSGSCSRYEGTEVEE